MTDLSVPHLFHHVRFTATSTLQLRSQMRADSGHSDGTYVRDDHMDGQQEHIDVANFSGKIHASICVRLRLRWFTW